MKSKGLLKWQKVLQEVEKSYSINSGCLETTKRSFEITKHSNWTHSLGNSATSLWPRWKTWQKNLPNIRWPWIIVPHWFLDYYPLLISHVGRAFLKSHLGVIGQSREPSGHWNSCLKCQEHTTVLNCQLPGMIEETETNHISTRLHDWYLRQNLEFFDPDSSDVLMMDKVHLCQRAKRSLCRRYQGKNLWSEL